VDEHVLTVDYADTSVLTPANKGRSDSADYDQRVQPHHMQNQQHQQRPAHFPSAPTDTMIVRNLDLNSTEESIRTAFDYITKKIYP